MTAGRVYLVGAGPGDPALITVRGLELLSQADVIVHDYLAPAELLARARPEAERIYVGKRAGRHTLSQDEINALLIDRARGGATVVRLKGGDPFVFGRGGEEALALAEAHVAFEIVPGVTAAVAAAAYAGIPVTHRGLTGGVALVTGHEAPDKKGTDLDFRGLADWPGTLAFYMGVSNLATICRELIAHGLDPDTPAAVVQWGTTPRQRTLTGTVGDLPRLAADAHVKPPAVILIGQVVRLRDKLQWFERRPLFGRRIVVTRPRAQAAGLTDRLRRLGADVLELPAIRIEPPDDPKPLEDAAAAAGAFDWILFTSVNAVDAFFAALRRVRADSRALGGVRVGSIGPATTERLGRYGIRPDAQPAEFTTAELVGVVASLGDLDGAKVLCPRADVAGPEMVRGLTARGADVREVVAYRTVPDGTGADVVAEELAGGRVHWITFTSPSTATSFFGFLDAEVVRSGGVRVGSIGPVTSAALKGLGLAPAVEADPHTIDGLVRAILEREDAT